MNTVREVDLQLAPAARTIVNHLIDRRRTKSLTRIAILLRATRGADVRIEHVKVTRLVFAVTNRGMVNVSQLVESNLAVKLQGPVALLDIISSVTVR